MSNEFEAEAQRLFECAHNNFGWMPIAESLRKAYEGGRAEEREHMSKANQGKPRAGTDWEEEKYREMVRRELEANQAFLERNGRGRNRRKDNPASDQSAPDAGPTDGDR